MKSKIQKTVQFFIFLAVAGTVGALAFMPVYSTAAPAPAAPPAAASPVPAAAASPVPPSATPEPSWWSFTWGGKNFSFTGKAIPTPMPTPVPDEKYRLEGFVLNPDGTPMPYLKLVDGKSTGHGGHGHGKAATSPKRVKPTTAYVPAPTEAPAPVPPTPTPTPTPYYEAPTPESTSVPYTDVYDEKVGIPEQAVAFTVWDFVQDRGASSKVAKVGVDGVFNSVGFQEAFRAKCQELLGVEVTQAYCNVQLRMMLAKKDRRAVTLHLMEKSFFKQSKNRQAVVASIAGPALRNSFYALRVVETSVGAYGSSTLTSDPENIWIGELLSWGADPLAAQYPLKDVRADIFTVLKFLRATAGMPRGELAPLKGELKTK